jgi:hypothetical protein
MQMIFNFYHFEAPLFSRTVKTAHLDGTNEKEE